MDLAINETIRNDRLINFFIGAIMKKYTVLSYNFGNYDLIRDPIKTDPEADYIYVTDKEGKSNVWNIIEDEDLKDKDPLYASFYVRHHPFKYAKTDIVIIVDASIQIQDSLKIIFDRFVESQADYSLMLNNYKNDEMKLMKWGKSGPKRISHRDIKILDSFIKKMKQSNFAGAVGLQFSIVKNNQIMQRFLKHVWRYVIALGSNGRPIRIDEIVVHKLLYKYIDKISLFLLSPQIIQSTFMAYCRHNSPLQVEKYLNYDQYYYLCNKPIYPNRIDKRILFPTSFKYKTEVMLLTKYLNPADLREWLDHHLNKCKFDRVHVFDNESGYDAKSVCDEYGDRVTYERIEGQAYQYRLYDSYIECRSNAEWIIALDDDEYLDIGKFESVYDAIMYYRCKFPHMDMLSVRWKHLFPKKFHTERTGKVLDYCTEENTELAKKFMWLGDGTIKTFVRRYGKIHYEEIWENSIGGHVPKSSVFFGSLLCNGKTIRGVGIPNCPYTLEDERIRILHCRYKGFSEYTKKMEEEVSVSDSIPKKKHWKFDEILPTLE